MSNEYFPTNFAISIAKSHGLYTNKEIPVSRYPDEINIWHFGKKAGQAHERLQMFQTVSLKLPFDNCLNIYAGIKLTKKQLKILRKIHQATPHWMKGKFISNILGRSDMGLATTQEILLAAQMLGLIDEHQVIKQ